MYYNKMAVSLFFRKYIVFQANSLDICDVFIYAEEIAGKCFMSGGMHAVYNLSSLYSV